MDYTNHAHINTGQAKPLPVLIPHAQGEIMKRHARVMSNLNESSFNSSEVN
jgi:hypothetical protein